MSVFAVISGRDEEGAVEELGRVTLDSEGYAIASTPEVADLLDDTRVIWDGEDIDPEDGRDYITALPFTFRGAMLWADVRGS